MSWSCILNFFFVVLFQRSLRCTLWKYAPSHQQNQSHVDIILYVCMAFALLLYIFVRSLVENVRNSNQAAGSNATKHDKKYVWITPTKVIQNSTKGMLNAEPSTPVAFCFWLCQVHKVFGREKLLQEFSLLQQ